MWKTLSCMTLAAALAADPAEACAKEPVQLEPRNVDLAICLDTSGSMEGLLDSARRRIWTIVSELARAKPSPRLRVALLTFGNTGHTAESGWVSVDAELTDDLDLVSQRLFALTTNGGDEYVARVVQTAAERLAWSPDAGALRLVLVAGNESAEQDPAVPVAEACKVALRRGLAVNTFYCGGGGDPDAAGWRRVAEMAEGRFAVIDQQRGAVAQTTPFDDRLAAMSAELNTTYVAFGAHAAEKKENQARQDEVAGAASPSAAADRAAAKSTELYRCTWDLVDASREKDFDLAKVAKDDLPAELRDLAIADLRKRIEALTAQRAALQERIRAVDAERQAWLAEKAKAEAAADGADSFDAAVRRAVREQAEGKGFRFE